MLRQLGVLLPLLLGCGRSTHGTQELGGPAAGQTTLDEGGQGGAAAPATGGAQTAGGDASLAPLAGSPTSGAPEPGAAGASDAPFVRDGTRYCHSAEDCLGSDCIGFSSTLASICSSACETRANCNLGELCIGVGELSPLCLQPCQSAEDCAYGFDCVHYQDIGTFCLPAPWTEQFMHPMP